MSEESQKQSLRDRLPNKYELKWRIRLWWMIRKEAIKGWWKYGF